MPATKVLAVAAHDTSGVFTKREIERREPGKTDVDIEIHYCGICHTDLHKIRAEWPGPALYPMVPGHEIVGIVKSVGSEVKKFKAGDRVGVGCLVDSCRKCASCAENEEQYCSGGAVMTYAGATDWNGAGNKTEILPGHDKEITFGGYSQTVVVDEGFVCSIPEGMDFAKSAPLLCAGITTYSPLKFWGCMEKGKDCKVGIIGFGGLGHMGVKIARAAGNDVTVFSTSESKKAAIEKLGAKVVISKDPEQMKAVSGSFDFILDTVGANHELSPYLGALKSGKGAVLCVVGVPGKPFSVHSFELIARKQVAGSLIGGIAETQEMLEFCAKHNILPDIELIHPKEVNRAMNDLASNAAAANRFVIDVKEGLVAGDWEVEPCPKIDVKDFCPHPGAVIIPASAIHATHAATKTNVF